MRCSPAHVQAQAALQAGISQILVAGLEGIGETIGNILSGKKNPFAELGKMLGGAIKALGAQLIKLGVAAKVIQDAISKLIGTPGSAIAVIVGGRVA